MSETTLVLVSIIAFVLVIVLAIWRYDDLKARISALGTGLSLSGRSKSKVREQDSIGNENSETEIMQEIQGNVENSIVLGAANDVLNSAQQSQIRDTPTTKGKVHVKTTVGGTVKDSTIISSGGNITNHSRQENNESNSKNK